VGPLTDGPHPEVNDLLARARFLDHHVHTILAGRLPAHRLLEILSESNRPEAARRAGMETQLGVALRRWCAPLLGLPVGVSGDVYLAHRADLDNGEVAARLLPAAGLAGLLVDTGYPLADVVPLAELAVLAQAPVRPVLRLEELAERVIARIDRAEAFPAAFQEALAEEGERAIGVKSIVAYRVGLDLDLRPPRPDEVVKAAGAWRASRAAGVLRLADPVIEAFLLWSAVELGKPLQIHTGFGDPDLDLHRANPLLLTDFLRRTEGRLWVLLLHTYPFHREAAYLAHVFPHVAFDVGLAVHHSGVGSEGILAETLEIAPWSKVLFSSDAWGIPELHLLGSWLVRRGLARIVGRWVAAGDWGLADAERFVNAFAIGNAREIYGLTDADLQTA
jgi:predicted TIM-barrel fold metal-dependent hydrolase